MINTQEYSNIGQIRSEIDEIDRKIIGLISDRAKFVKEASRFKKDAASVTASDRVEQMIRTRRTWAYASNLNADFIESIYRKLVAYFTAVEMNEFDKGRNV